MSLNCIRLALPVLLLLATRAAAAPQAGVKFGDVEIETKSVVFICDGSRWTKNKIKELSDELISAVEAMSPEQQVAVLFFADDKAYGPAGGKLLPATDENKRTIKDWLKDVELGQEPTPVPALTRAFEAKPETIVFISDGKFEHLDDVESLVAARNRDHAVHVFTIGFFRSDKEDDSRSFVDFMTKLADQNGGKFKAIYADELRKRSG